MKGRASDYLAVFAWGGILLLIGAGAWCFGMAIHARASAQHVQHPAAAVPLIAHRADT